MDYLYESPNHQYPETTTYATLGRHISNDKTQLSNTYCEKSPDCAIPASLAVQWKGSHLFVPVGHLVHIANCQVPGNMKLIYKRGQISNFRGQKKHVFFYPQTSEKNTTYLIKWPWLTIKHQAVRCKANTFLFFECVSCMLPPQHNGANFCIPYCII